MLEVDSALAAAGIDPVWLHRRSDQMPQITAGSDACRSNGRGSALADPGDSKGIGGASRDAKASSAAVDKRELIAPRQYAPTQSPGGATGPDRSHGPAQQRPLAPIRKFCGTQRPKGAPRVP
jgi:hypothetical protein